MQYYTIANADEDKLRFGTFKTRQECVKVLKEQPEPYACYVAFWNGDGSAMDDLLGQINGEEFLAGSEPTDCP